jgi:YhcH/YjgK/YiaL family protein
MKKLIVMTLVLIGFFGMAGSKIDSDPSTWSKKQIDQWFEKGEWLNGWTVKPDSSINRKEFAISYFKNKERWDKAFSFLKNSDLLKLEVKRTDIDGDNLYATVSEFPSKNEADGKFEVHRKYIDIQYVIKGTVQMGVTPMSMRKDITAPYNDTKDIEFQTVTKFSSHIATPDTFFIFFPSDIHRPDVKVNESVPVRKVVLKVKVN